MKQPRLKATLTEAQKAAIETGLLGDFDFEQVRFNTQTGRPIFSLKELQRLTNALCPNLASTEIEPTVLDEQKESATVYVVFQIKDGPTIHRNATVRLGDAKFESEDTEMNDAPETVQSVREAEGLAKYRAFMAAMDGAGFDLTKALLNKYATPYAPTEVTTGELKSLRERLISLGKATHFIVGDNWTNFDQLLQYTFGKSLKELTADEMKDQIALLSSKLRRERTELQQAA